MPSAWRMIAEYAGFQWSRTVKERIVDGNTVQLAVTITAQYPYRCSTLHPVACTSILTTVP